jgi:protein TonB
LREPPRGEGGPVRAFVLIALLGGAALAGGLYFGGGLDMNFGTPTEQVADAATTNALDAPGDVPVGEAGGDAPSFLDPEFQAQSASRRTQTAAAPPAAQPRERTSATEQIPAPVTNFGMGGPISLSPGDSSVQPGAPVSLDPPATSQPPASSPTLFASASPLPAPSTSAPQTPAATVSWAQRPTARRIADLYPSRALRQGVGGRVQLDCVVQTNYAVACSILSETPPGLGFGSAALSAANSYRAQPQLSDGASAVGSHARIAVAFQAPQ